MKSSVLRWIIILAVLAVLAIPRFLKKDKGGAPKGPGGPQGPIPVEGLRVQARTIGNNIRASGTLLANEEVELQCETNGKVVSIYFEEGKPVRKGQLLLKINDAELLAQLRKTESRVHLVEDMERRQKELLKKEGISQSEYDMALNDLNAARAELSQLKEQIRKTEIVAPFNGVVGLKYISEGAFVTPSSRIASLQNVDRIKVEFAVPEQYATRVHQGSLIKFKLENAEKTYTASVYAIEPRIDAQTRNVTLRAVCANEAGLFPGSFASVEVVLDEMKNVLMIPTDVVIPVLKGQKVYVIRGDSVVENKIETGMRLSDLIQVKSGLQAGDTIVTTGLMQLKKGSKIKLKAVKG